MDASLLAGWENFYVITGSSAGGLTGITFVVIALIRDVQHVGPTPAGLRAFVTPMIVHFGGVLALAAYLSMPHQGVMSLSVGFGVAGLAGLIYGGVIAANMRRPGSAYVPVHEDWIWNVALPTLVYGGLLVMAFLVWRKPVQTLYGVAVACLLLLFIGIRNAWDIAVWMTVKQQREPH
jgi:hypothetical protein